MSNLVAAPVDPSVFMPSRTDRSAGLGVDGEEIYQLVKRSDVNPHDVEIVGAHTVEVSVLWKSAILHVAHLAADRDFLLTTHEAPRSNAGRALLGGLGAGTTFIATAAATGNYALGAAGTVMALAGAGAGIMLDRKNQEQRRDVSRFVVGAEMLPSGSDCTIVRNTGGLTRFVFVPGARGEVEIDGVRRTLDELIVSGIARASGTVPGGHEVDVQPKARFRMEVGGLTILARVVAPGRAVTGGARRDPATMWAGAGAAGAVALLIGAAVFSTTNDGFVNPDNANDSLNELAAIQRMMHEREPEPTPQHPTQDQPNTGAAGQRAAGAEGAMGARTAPPRNARYSVARHENVPQQFARATASQTVAHLGIFAALNGSMPAESASNSGPVNPFGGLQESGVDAESHDGRMNGDTIGDAYGFGGFGNVGTGHGGGGDGQGTVGTGPLGTMGHGNNQEGFGGTTGHPPPPRGTTGPILRHGPIETTGLLAPEAIRRVVLRNIGQVQHCQEQGMIQDPSLQGRVSVRFVINGEGSVIGSGVVDNNVPVASVAPCIANAVRRWMFPAPEGHGIVTVTYPFILQPAQ